MKTSSETLAENLEALAKHHGLKSDDAIGKRCSISQKTAWRIRHLEQAVTIERLDSIAKGFGLMAWQMLVPGLDPKNPPVFAITDTEKLFYERVRDSMTALAAEPPPSPYRKK